MSGIQEIEAGRTSSLDGYARLALALGIEPSFSLHAERPKGSIPDADAVHAAMGEAEAGHLTAVGFEVLLDEPYQHYQFAGRADLVAVDRANRALLHLENRTRFPDVQAAVGSYNAKRAYLAPQLAERLDVRGGFSNVTHVIVALWSAEVLHTLRLRESTFRAVCPDPSDEFGAWWNGKIPDRSGSRSTLVLFDAVEGRRSTRRRWGMVSGICGLSIRATAATHTLWRSCAWPMRREDQRRPDRALTRGRNRLPPRAGDSIAPIDSGRPHATAGRRIGLDRRL